MKKDKILLTVMIVFLIISFLFLSASSSEAAYPEKPVTMIVAYSPGGGTDTFARVIVKYAESYFGQPIIIENKPGAAGQIGFQILAKAVPDGYTFGMINIPSMNLIIGLRPNIPFALDDFNPIACFQLDPGIIAVKEDSSFNTMQELLDYAKDNPGKINLAAEGPRGNWALQEIVARDMLDFKTNFIPYSGSGPANLALLSGDVDVALVSASSAMTHIKDGRIRALTVFLPETYELLPDVPTIKEATGVEVPPAGASARGIAVPKGVSNDKVKVLGDAFIKAFNDPKFKAQAMDLGIPLKYMSSEEFLTHMKEANELVEKYKDLFLEE